MMRRIGLTALMFLALAGLTLAQTPAQEERRFVKIVHSTDGTTAIDSSGQSWRYDAEAGVFVPSSETTDSGRSSLDDEAGDEVLLPPEIRCTDIRYGDITNFFDDIEVALDQRVEGSVTGGKDIVIRGLVTGDVVSFQKVIIERSGEVRGDVTAREIHRERGGRILGQRREVDIPDVDINLPEAYGGWRHGVVALFLTGLLIFVVVIIIAMVPANLDRVHDKVVTRPIASFFWGLLAWIAVGPVFGLLVITIVGIPVAILIYPLVILAAILLGFSAVAIYVGGLICPRLGLQEPSKYIKAICGVVALEALQALLVLMALIGIGGLATMFLVFYIIAAAVMVTIGFGAVLSARFGVVRKRRATVIIQGGATVHVPQPPPVMGGTPLPLIPTPPPAPTPPPSPAPPDGDPSKGALS